MLSPPKKIGWERVASVLVQEVDTRGPFLFPFALDWLGAQRSQIRSGVVRLGEHQAFKVTTASKVRAEESQRNEGLQQSVQGQRAGCPQLILSFLALFFGAVI